MATKLFVCSICGGSLLDNHFGHTDDMVEELSNYTTEFTYVHARLVAGLTKYQLTYIITNTPERAIELGRMVCGFKPGETEFIAELLELSAV